MESERDGEEEGEEELGKDSRKMEGGSQNSRLIETELPKNEEGRQTDGENKDRLKENGKGRK